MSKDYSKSELEEMYGAAMRRNPPPAADYDINRLLNRLYAAEEVVKQVRQQNPLTFRSTGLVYALNTHSKIVSEWRDELYGDVDGG